MTLEIDVHNSQAFLEAWKLVMEHVRPLPKPEYRCYFEAVSGRILTYSMENLPGNYIVINKDQFAACRYDHIVKNGELCAPRPIVIKLRPASQGTATDPDDVTIIASNEMPHTKWSPKSHED